MAVPKHDRLALQGGDLIVLAACISPYDRFKLTRENQCVTFKRLVCDVIGFIPSYNVASPT